MKRAYIHNVLSICIGCFVLLFMAACRRDFEAPIPTDSWQAFDQANALKIPFQARERMNGIYQFTSGSDRFGKEAALKWTYTAVTDSLINFSFYCEQDGVYIICEGRSVDSTLYLKGYWRKITNSETGLVRITIDKNTGGRVLMGGQGTMSAIVMSGLWGNNQGLPINPFELRYNRPLHNGSSFRIVAHRGGGRTSDLLPASENSVELIRMASSLGANGIEIDVRMTSDHVPVLFHDATLNERLIQKNGMLGPVESYSFAQLRNLVRLIKGEQIPTLNEVLHTVVHETPLQFVWLDTKFYGDMAQVRALQQQYQQEANAAGRDLTILIGVPDTDVEDHFKQLPNYTQIPSVCELDPSDVQELNSKVWGPRFTLGFQHDAVAQMHAQGRKAYVWTLDVPANIREYLDQSEFDGILTNYPSILAYAYYAR